MDVYDRCEGETEAREAMKQQLCDAINAKVDERARVSRLLAEADKILEEVNDYRRSQREIRQMIENRDIRWYLLVWKRGYFCCKLNQLGEEKERRDALVERMQRMKRVRPAAERYKPIGCAFLPASRRLVIDISALTNVKKGMVAMTQMINYYCDNYGVYQYSPLPGTGYKYYSGERLIIYVITEEMSKNQIKEMVKGIKINEIEGYKLKNTFKVIINASKWQGCKDWRREMILDYDMAGKPLDIREQMLLAWKNCKNIEELNRKCLFLKRCQRKQLEPWPFVWHQFNGMELVDESRESLERRQEAFRAGMGDFGPFMPGEAK